MAKRPEGSRVPSAVGAIPVVGDLVKSAESQARWMQEMLEENARLVGQLPATVKTFNDSIERFNQTIGRLDRAVTRIETASRNTQRQVAVLQSTIDRMITVLGELPGAGVLRRLTAGRDSADGALGRGGPGDSAG
jgi:ABC-type transporter Mla subunit MlaD